jgi:ketose-bisphosphate aldolase
VPLTNMKNMLKKANQGKYAVGAFNILDYNSMRAVVDAAIELKAPVIIQTSVKTVLQWGTKAIAAWADELCQDTLVTIALHLDHCQNIELIAECIKNGWSSVMIDASSKPFEENIKLTQHVVELAKPFDISVEAELGAIVGVEDDIHVNEQDAHLADANQSELFCKTLDIDCFAPAIGTAHGVYKGEPQIAFHLVEDIFKRTGIPLALHGGTGLSNDVFSRCIDFGCAKVNISTQLKYAFIDSFVQYYQNHQTEYNPLKPIDAQYKVIKESVKENIKLFGGAGKADV